MTCRCSRSFRFGEGLPCWSSIACKRCCRPNSRPLSIRILVEISKIYSIKKLVFLCLPLSPLLSSKFFRLAGLLVVLILPILLTLLEALKGLCFLFLFWLYLSTYMGEYRHLETPRGSCFTLDLTCPYLSSFLRYSRISFGVEATYSARVQSRPWILLASFISLFFSNRFRFK